MPGTGSSAGRAAAQGHHGRPRPSHQHGVCGLHGRCAAAAGVAGGWPSPGDGDPARQATAPMKAGQWLGVACEPASQATAKPPARGMRVALAVPRCRWCGWWLAWSRQWRSSTPGTGTSAGRAASQGHHGRPRPGHQHGARALHGQCAAAAGVAGVAGGWPGQGGGDPACRASAPAQAGQQLRAVGGPLWQATAKPPARARGLHWRCPAAAGAVGRWPGQGSDDPARQAPAPMKTGQWLRGCGLHKQGTAKRPGR
jgi:hypothetical protein